MEAWRKRYNDLLFENQQRLQEEHADLGEKYQAALEARMKGFQEAGKLDAVLHVQELIGRVKRSRPPASLLQSERDPYVPELRLAYHKAWTEMSESAAEREEDIREAYLKRLEAEMVRHTQAGDIDRAVQFREEMDEVRGMGKAPGVREAAEGPVSENRTVQQKVLEWGTSRYTYVQKPLSWKKARDLAEQMGGHLLILETPEERDAVKELIGHHRVWVGAYEVEPGKWQWVDGTPLDRGMKGMRMDFSSRNQSEPALTMKARGVLSDTEEEFNPKRVRGFVLETPQ